MSNKSFSSWLKSGSPWVWLNAGAVSISLVMVVGLLSLIAVRGLSHFWPADLMAVTYTEPGKEAVILVGEKIDTEEVSAQQLSRTGVVLPDGQASAKRILLKVGNRDYFGLDFRWVNQPWIGEITYPQALLSIERREWGHFYGRLLSVKQQGEIVVSGEDAYQELQLRLKRSNKLVSEIKALEKGEIGKINAGLEEIRLERRKLELREVPKASIQYAELIESEKLLDVSYKALQQNLAELYQALNRDQMMVVMSDGREVEIPFAKVVEVYQPNAMNLFEKFGVYFHELWKFVSGDPREANTEGGVFPAIFGTVMMVMIHRSKLSKE